MARWTLIYASLALAVLFFAGRRLWTYFGPGKQKDERHESAHQPHRSPAAEHASRHEGITATRR